MPPYFPINIQPTCQILLSPYTFPSQFKSKSPLPPAKPVVSNFGCSSELPVETWYNWSGSHLGIKISKSLKVIPMHREGWRSTSLKSYMIILSAIKTTSLHYLESDLEIRFFFSVNEDKDRLVIFKLYFCKICRVKSFRATQRNG